MQETLKITCPKCGETFPLDETLAGPMIAKVRAEADDRVTKMQQELVSKQQLAQQRESDLAAKERLLSEREAAIQTQVNQKLATERLKIVEEERKNARAEIAPEIEAEKTRLIELERQLGESQRAELALRQEKSAIEARARTLDLEVARKVDEQRQAIQEQASKDVADENRLKMAEKDQLIQQLKEQAEDLKRKATQGSQQTQGDVLEVDFEAALRQAFPQDTIEPVKAGARGGDVLQRVLGEMGRPVGTLFWETKRAQAWGSDWCGKAKQDATAAKAEAAIIVSDVLPKGINDFGPQDGVWVVRPTHAVMLGVVLRNGVISTSEARQSAIGKESKMERLYAYMIGPEFRAMIEGIALPFHELHEELNSEKKSTLARWKRQERRIERVLTSVAGLQGDLRGIGGSEMPELPGFGVDEEPNEDDDD